MKPIKNLLILLIATITISSCKTAKVYSYDFTPNYIQNTVDTKVIVIKPGFTKYNVERDTLNFGNLTPTEFQAFIDYFIIESFRENESNLTIKSW